MNIKKIIGKQVFSLYEGELIGTIINVGFNTNYTKINSFTIFNEDDDEFCIPFNSVFAIGDGIIIKNKSKINTYITTNNLSCVFKEVFDENANSFGFINDFVFDKNGNIQKYITNSNIEIFANKINVRKNFVIFFKNTLKVFKYKPKNNKLDLSKIKVKVLNINQANFLPSKLQYNPQNILGRISKGDLVGLNNEVIIKTNQVITEKTIQDATRHNRLNQLFYLAN